MPAVVSFCRCKACLQRDFLRDCKAVPAPKDKAPAGQRRRVKKGPETSAEPAEAPETRPCPSEEPSSTRVHPESCRLLTSLKYQCTSKKASAAHRERAEEILQQYAQSTKQEKWNIMERLLEHGVKDLSSWSHSATEEVKNSEVESSNATEGMMTMHQILALNRLQARDLTEDEQRTTLQDLLDESSELYGHEQRGAAHRYFYKVAEGKDTSEVNSTDKSWTSYAEVKQKGLSRLLDQPGEALPAQEGPKNHESWDQSTGAANRLKKMKMSLSKLEDGLAQAEESLRRSEHRDKDGHVQKLKEQGNPARLSLGNPCALGGRQRPLQARGRLRRRRSRAASHAGKA